MKKQISNWTKMGYIFGITFSISSLIRYFIIYIDHSQGLIFMFAGLTIVALSWLYEQNRQKGARDDSRDEFLREVEIFMNKK